jgi:division/cell wall cluster transcriptional repressor MraZ
MAGAGTRSKSAVIRPAPPFLGQHLRGVDNGRVILPVEWRGTAREFMVMLWPVIQPKYLLVLPPARWEVLQKNLEQLSLADDQAALVERAIGAGTSVRSIDSYGRLPLPEDFPKLGIEKEAMLVGRMNKFEIWGPAEYAASQAALNSQLIGDALKAIKI